MAVIESADGVHVRRDVARQGDIPAPTVRFVPAVNEAEPGVSALAAAIRPPGGGATLGTVSVAGPSARMSESRVQELAPLVMQTASELASLWPLRVRAGRALPVKGVDAAA